MYVGVVLFHYREFMNVIVLGATGSIGTQTLELLQQFNDQLIGFSFGKNLAKAKTIIEAFRPQVVCAKHEHHASQLKESYPNLQVVFGSKGLITLASLPGDITLVNALVGSVGLLPTVKAIETKKRICLANKETLVIAGELIMKLVKQHNVTFLPVDSEHVAIHQAMQGDPNIASLVLTASGGSLRTWSREDLINATKEDVLAHPNWSMGDKITVDSATMMNKGFELLEAHHLFGLPYERIQTVLHPESMIHGMVTYSDGSVIAQLARPTMSIPIAYALYYPTKLKRQPFDFTTLSSLRFSPMDETRYPLIKLARTVGLQGGILACVMNAANEAAVRLFLTDVISFHQIESIIIDAVNNYKNEPLTSIEQVVRIDQEVFHHVIDTYSLKRGNV
jgi:1-deoxy-D-xylulose-5-phosphate reductoisomerase